MPARSNTFQRLIRAIQGHMSAAGTVTESRMLADRHTGSRVEVDIVIEQNVGGHTLLIGIECTAKNRKATIEWYREMRSKHADLPINKTVLVSQSGFTPEVHRKASIDGITLLSLAEATAFKWRALFDKLQGGTVAEVGFTLRKATLTMRSASGEAAPVAVGREAIIRGPGFEYELDWLIMTTAVNSGLTRQVMANLGAILTKTDHITFGFIPPEGSYVVEDDQRFDVLDIGAVLTIHPTFQPMNLRPVDFNGQTVAVSDIPARFIVPGSTGQSIVTISQNAGDSMKVSVLAPDDEDIELDVFPHALWPGNHEPGAA